MIWLEALHSSENFLIVLQLIEFAGCQKDLSLTAFLRSAWMCLPMMLIASSMKVLSYFVTFKFCPKRWIKAASPSVTQNWQTFLTMSSCQELNIAIKNSCKESWLLVSTLKTDKSVVCKAASISFFVLLILLDGILLCMEVMEAWPLLSTWPSSWTNWKEHWLAISD